MEVYWQGKKGSSLRKISLSATFSYTNLTRTALGSNLCLGATFNCKILLSALRTIQKQIKAPCLQDLEVLNVKQCEVITGIEEYSLCAHS